MRTRICLLTLLIFGTAYAQPAVRRIEGRIRASGGDPLSGDVTVVQAGSAAVLATHLTDAVGAFSLDVPLGRVLLVAKADHHVSAEQEVAPGVTRVEFVLLRAGTVSGRVIDETGGVSNAGITLSYRGERRLFSFGDEAGDVVTDAAGYFTLPMVAQGKPFVIHAATGDGPPSSSGTLMLRGDRMSGVVVPMARKGQSVRGLVVDALGSPVAGAAVRMRSIPDAREFDEDERHSFAFLRATNRTETTDRNGVFQFQGVAPGRVILVVEPRTGRPASEEAVLAAGQDLTIRMVLR